MTIHRAVPAELDDVMTLVRECTEQMHSQGINQWDENYPNAHILMEDIRSGWLHTYRDGEEIVGMMTLDENQEEEFEAISWRDQGGRALIAHRLAVKPSHQGQGIAKKLLAFADNYAQEQGYSSLRFDSYSKNTKAVELYKRLGYEVRGEIVYPSLEFPFYVFEKHWTAVSN
ncbi:GNAT family N-acetyltransferase [Paenibacillus profundus]|uniref:GNAT family N-acetyltransferase n=1 Tax=Paenibacillus profundus TaxID=1173085 RepID=A0ABS8YL89_9BACL|nr:MULTISPECIES: GNAT family N-acetyltransferase [Paenibacillus]MCE5171694.1 GNAT family N-acetyltransferase [Paenibacillus profundus]MCM3337581.1 GNAT family N-acetyltransferase [Paenibacillus sp. MER TA 81-3]